MGFSGQRTSGGGGAGITSILIGNTLFVDKVYGDDGTALPYRFDKPYKTITAAQTAAVSGDTIYIDNGAYTDTNLGKDGIRYEFAMGAVLTSSGNCFRDNGVSMSYKVVGFGIFSATSTVCLTTGAASVVEFECWSATGVGVGSRCFWVQSGSNVLVRCATDISNGSAGGGSEATLRLETHATNTPKLTVYANRIVSESIPLQTKNNLATGKLYVSAKEIVMAAAGDNYTILEWIGGQVEVHADIITTTNSNYGIAMFNGGGDTLKVYGNMSILSNKCIAVSGGTVEFFGEILTTGTIINSGADLYFKEKIVSSTPVTVSTGEAMKHDGGLTIIEHVVVNVNNNQPVIKATSNGIILKQAAVLYVTGTADSIESTDPYDFRAYPGSSTNSAVDVNMTDLLASLFVDANVVSQ